MTVKKLCQLLLRSHRKNSLRHDCLTVADTGKMFFFLCWQKSTTVMFIVEEWCHVPGIRHMIPCFSFFILLDVEVLWFLYSNGTMYYYRLCRQKSTNNITGSNLRVLHYTKKDFFSKCEQVRRKLLIFGHIYWRSPDRKTSFLCSAGWI